MILVTGASGKTGRAVVRALVGRNQQVRALVHRENQAGQLRQMGAVEIQVGDLNSLPDLMEAARGVRTIYHICPNVNPDEITIGERVIAAAHHAGVERFVFHSVLHPQTEAMPHHWQKMRVEELIFESGLDFTILQPAIYMQNILAYWQQISVEGVYAVPYSQHARLAMVDLDDVAAVAARVLTEAGHAMATYELTGIGSLSPLEIAIVISQKLGFAVHSSVIPILEWEAHARQNNMPEYAIDTLVRMFRYYGQFGLPGNPKVLTMLMGRQPTSFSDFLERVLQEQKP